ncbi:hypothetical protein K2X33_08515 [bacterium]|nr:hypothetical protein [bacterium]
MKRALFPVLFLASIALAENQPQQAGAKGSNVTIFDDTVFNLNGSQDPDTRTSVGGNTRYLDKTKNFDYNSETRQNAIGGCDSLREKSYKAFQECVNSKLSPSRGSSSVGTESLIQKKPVERPDPATGDPDLGIGDD